MVNDATPGVSLADYGVWRSNFGTTVGSTVALAVPEPSTHVRMPIAALGVLIQCRRKSVHRNRV